MDPAELRPSLDPVFACCGFDRVMLGGDWPLSSPASDIPRWVATLDEARARGSPDELHRLYVRNAESVDRG